jgi:hypothetical protein
MQPDWSGNLQAVKWLSLAKDGRVYAACAVADEQTKREVAARASALDTRVRDLGHFDSYTAPAHRLRIGTVLGGGRLHILQAIGEGGMGIVYEAFDAERRGYVALKTLSHLDAAGIYRLKNEFRALSDVRHRNLVRLHQLFFDDQHWFFTMDLVEGERFDRWVRPEGRLDERRLRSALGQLVDALDAIHAAGKLHRDVKPGNVLVTSEARVVVLDFGLVAEPQAGGVGQTIPELGVTGTPDYMAPEQAAGRGAVRASDFYALGVMLFEALAGKLPFEGHTGEVLAAKQRDAPPPLCIDAGSPVADLAQLCSALLSRRPEDRPDAASVRACLAAHRPEPALSETAPALRGGAPTPTEPRAPAPPSGDTPALIGREIELALLRDAYRATRAGSAVVVAIAGESGIGKTALCQAFLRELRAGEHAVVLASRCYERETVPFKAIDPLVDELTRYLRRLSPERVAALLPRDAFALARLFPALERLPAIADAPAHDVDAHELRRRAVGAFGELIARMRDRQPLVVCIDDAQWTDADSVVFLRQLLAHRRVAPALLIVSHRAEHAHRTQPVGRVLDAVRANKRVELRTLELNPLAPGDTARLARQVLAGDDGAAVDATSVAIAEEARGSPFFAIELARFARSASEHVRRALSLSALIAERAALLPPAARALLEVTALVGRPLAVEVLLDAARAVHSDLDALRDAQLARVRESGGRKQIECYHDRIRESLYAELPTERAREHYARLAQALERYGDADPELRSRCLEHAGDREGAARQATIAADRAADAIAFDRAAALYRRALKLADHPPHAQLELMTKLGGALESTGRGGEAAEVFKAAAELGSGETRLELQRRAAEQLLAIGHTAEGMELARAICRQLGVRFSDTASAALVALALTRLRLRVRGLEARRARATSARDALRLHTAHTVMIGLIGYLPVHSASVAAGYLRMALDAGDVPHLVRALGYNAVLGAIVNRNAQWPRLLVSRMTDLALEDGSREVLGVAELMHGVCIHNWDGFAESRRKFGRAIKALRDCRGVAWELDLAHILDQTAAHDCGDYVDIARTTPALIDEALRRGRIYTGAMLSGVRGLPAWLAPDDASGYARQLAEARRFWHPQEPRRWPDHFLLMGEALLSIYVGEPERGFELLEAERAAHARSLHVVASASSKALYTGRHALCAAAALRAPQARHGDPARARWLANIRAAIAHLRRHGGAAARSQAETLEAVLSLCAHDTAGAITHLRRAITIEDEAGLVMVAAATRRRLGQLIGGDHGKALVHSGEAVMLRQGVKNLEAMTELVCPGCRSG